jgi:hypothetical protein
MSNSTKSTGRLPSAQQPRYLTAHSAADLAGVARPTLLKYLTPDASYLSAGGDKSFPLWLPETVEAFRAKWTVEISGGAE